MRRRRTSDMPVGKVFLGLVVVLIILYGINVFLTAQMIAPIKSSAESNRPANLHLTLIANDCENCYDMNNVVSFIKRQNVNIIQERILQYSDKEAQELMSENDIDSLPALIVTGETFKESISSLWDALGVQSDNGVVVVSGYPPYYSLDEQKVVGLVEVIRLIDNSCAECYDVETHMQILPRFGVYVDKSLTYDISSGKGKELIQKYNITKVPTTILSPDADVYSSLTQIWDQVGTVEDDGWYVFRAVEQMGTYKDLAGNKIVNATR